ncbi:MAG: hypothetical protein V4722_03995 [Bacteroidota bacterium]
MKRISVWAGRHVKLSRVLLVLLHLWLIVAATLISNWLGQNNIRLSAQWFFLPIAACLLLTMAMEVFKYRLLRKTSRFVLSKSKFGLIAICSFLFIVSLFHADSLPAYNNYTVLHSASVKSEAKKEKPVFEDYADKDDFYADLRDYYGSQSKKELKKELKMQFKEFGREGNGNAGIIILIILGALVALYGIAALACSIACGGSEALAVIVAFLGIGGVIWLAIYLIRKNGRKRTKTETGE